MASATHSNNKHRIRLLLQLFNHFIFLIMAASSSAILTLLTLVFAGPLFYACRFIYRRYFGLWSSKSGDSALGGSDDSGDEHQEIVSSSSYMLGLMGYAIGIGNVWRFPYLVGQYGGGAFVFAYAVCLFLIAMPLYLVELGLGQHTRCGAIATLKSKLLLWKCRCYSFELMFDFTRHSDQASLALSRLGPDRHGVVDSRLL